MYVVYDSNNSGGSWWLKKRDWEALERAGWIVHWVQPDSKYGGFMRSTESYENPLLPQERHPGAEWLGGVAMSAAKETDNLREAVEEWESVTGQDASAQGCNCCGRPHDFTLYDDEGKYVSSPSLRIETSLEY